MKIHVLKLRNQRMYRKTEKFKTKLKLKLKIKLKLKLK